MNLRRLKDATIDELRVRAAQRLAAFSERRGWSTLAKLPTDAEFASLFTAPIPNLLEHFRSRSEPKFFSSFKSPIETVAAFRSRWPNVAQRLIEKADRICEGNFDLLGCTNLSFGDPIDWHFEPCTGKRSPLVHWSKLDYLNADVAGDKRIVWELNRHQYFLTLGQAYWLTGDERYARVFTEHFDSWMDANPPKIGVNWTSSLEVAFRSMAWLWAFHFFKSSPSLATETFTNVCKFLYLNARHLESYLSTYFSPNTHLTGEALGLFFIGTMFPEFEEAKRWQDLGRRILIEQLPVQVKPDGVYFEQTVYYHRYTTDFYIHFLLLSRANHLTLPPQVENWLVLMLDHLMYITRPDGTTPFLGDDDGGRLAKLEVRPANDFRGTLGVASVLFSRGDYKFVAGDAAEELLWLLGVEGLRQFDNTKPQEPKELSRAFRHGGYFVMRDGWKRDSNYLIFDCGPHGILNCGHAHSDALSFALAAKGETILIDPGTCTYTGSKELRNWFRSSQAHNTVTVDGESSSVPNGTFTWKSIARCAAVSWISRKRFDFVSGEHDGFMRLDDPVTTNRSILFLKQDYWIVRDRLTSTGDHQADVRFHLAPAASPVVEGNVVRDPSTGFSIHSFGRNWVRGNWVREDSWFSQSYGQKQQADAYVFRVNFTGEAEIISFLMPSSGDWQITPIKAREGAAFIIDGANGQDLVIIRGEEWEWLRLSHEPIRKVREVVVLPRQGEASYLKF